MGFLVLDMNGYEKHIFPIKLLIVFLNERIEEPCKNLVSDKHSKQISSCILPTVHLVLLQTEHIPFY